MKKLASCVLVCDVSNPSNLKTSVPKTHLLYELWQPSKLYSIVWNYLQNLGDQIAISNYEFLDTYLTKYLPRKQETCLPGWKCIVCPTYCVASNPHSEWCWAMLQTQVLKENRLALCHNAWEFCFWRSLAPGPRAQNCLCALLQIISR